VKRFNRMSALRLAFAVGVTACNETVGLDEQDFDSSASAANLVKVASVFDSPVLLSLAESSTHFNSVPCAPQISTVFIDAGWELALDDGPWDVEQAVEQLVGIVPPDMDALVTKPNWTTVVSHAT